MRDDMPPFGGFSVGQIYAREGLLGILHGKIKTPLLISTKELNANLVTDGNHVLDLLGTGGGELRDVDHTLLTGSELNERTDRDDTGNNTNVGGACNGLEGNGLDDLLGLLGGTGDHGRDEHKTVIVDVDLGTGIGADLLDGLTAGADDLTDLIGIDGDAHHLGSVGAELGTGSGDGLEDDLVKDVVTRGVRGGQRLMDDLGSQTVDLEVHLDRGDTTPVHFSSLIPKMLMFTLAISCLTTSNLP